MTNMFMGSYKQAVMTQGKEGNCYEKDKRGIYRE